MGDVKAGEEGRGGGLLRWLAMLLPVPLLGVMTFALAGLRLGPGPLPKLYPIPAFSLTERGGAQVTAESLRGKVWVADFFFTTCPGPCLMMTQRMAELQKRLGRADDLRLVSFTVDPERDTPAALREYAARHGADPERWLFLTGDRNAIYELGEKGFRLATVDQGEGGGGPEGRFLHSTKMVLVDAEGFVRGYFDGVDPASVGKVAAAVKAVRREAGRR